MARSYGRTKTPEDVTRCAADVIRKGLQDSHQCERKRGFGPDGLLCRQHAQQFSAGSRTVWIPPDTSTWTNDNGED